MNYTDSSQQRIVEFSDGPALLLAGPGCGKTHILASRIYYAASFGGVPFDKMLCVTFTNRAAREMKDRIESFLGKAPEGLFVGNIHRFCLRFLFENQLLSAETGVLDDEDRREFLESIGICTAQQVKDFDAKAKYLYQTAHDFPTNLIQRLPSPITDSDLTRIEAYKAFKSENLLIDFDEILLKAYNSLADIHARDYAMTGYTWIQVDEVQDMNPLQLAIIEAVTSRGRHTCLFLGDEQQAIFNFTGAGGRALEGLKERCRGRILRLTRNYRSPRYLVELCNSLAIDWLDINPDFLPSAVEDIPQEDALSLYQVNAEQLPAMAAWQVNRWRSRYPNTDVAVLTRTNREADDLSTFFDSCGIEHFHISKQDLFHQLTFKSIWSHLAALIQPTHSQAWARLLYQTKAVKTLSGARKLTHLLRRNCIAYSELLDFEAKGSVERLINLSNDSRTIVVFDTETSGLNVFEDDIIQIAAVKMRGGEIVKGSEFEVFISTDRQIPATLRNGIPNPMAEVYKTAKKLTPDDAFRQFEDYVEEGAVLAGHNIEFDLEILRNNLKRRTSTYNTFSPNTSTRLDTLLLSKLLLPRLRSHSLESMIDALALQATNSHNANDDVLATALLLSALTKIAAEHIEGIRKIKSDTRIRKAAALFKANYGPLYIRHTLQREDSENSSLNTLAEVVRQTDQYLSDKGFTAPMQRPEYVLKLIDTIVVGKGEHTFREQLGKHLYDLLAFNEADLFSNGIVREKISIMTIHKAKGLEMENVVIYNAASGFGARDEENRILYVALSRARKRLTLGLGSTPPPVIRALSSHFRRLTPGEVKRAIFDILNPIRP